MLEWVKGCVRKGWGTVGALALCVIACVSEGVMAADTVTIPAMPVDFADIATQGAVVLGTVVAGVVGIFVLVALINMGIKWIRRAFTS